METSVTSVHMRVVIMSKETRIKIPEGVTRVINAATGEVKWQKHPDFTRSQFQSNELLYKAKAEYYELYTLTLEKAATEIKAELLLTKHALANATAKLHGTRKHATEVKIDG